MSGSDVKGIPPLTLEGNVAQNWMFWKQRFNINQKATENNKKKEDVQCAQLLNFMGEQAFRVYNTFEFEETEVNKLSILIAKFDNHFMPKKNVEYERHKFFTRKQLLGETIEQYVTVLKNLALSCEFSDLKDSLIKSILTCGVISDAMRQRLLEKEGESLEEAVKKCRAMEVSRNISEKVAEESEKNVNMVKTNRKYKPPCLSTSLSASDTPSTSKTSQRGREKMYSNNFNKNRNQCNRCGTTHLPQRCPAFRKMCSGCKKVGHFQKMCFFDKQVHEIYLQENSESDSESESESAFVGEVQEKKNNYSEWFVNIKIQGQEIKLKMDSGAMVNLLPAYVLKQLNI